MKRLLMICLALTLMLGMAVPATAESAAEPAAAESAAAEPEPEWELVTEFWDDYMHDSISYYLPDGTPHDCALCGTWNGILDEPGAFLWRQDGFLMDSTAHLAYVGSYAVVHLKKATHFEWVTRYAAEAENGVFAQATIYLDGVEVACLGSGAVNGAPGDYGRRTLWATDLDPETDHEIKIVNTTPMPEGFEGEENDWILAPVPIVFDGFEVTHWDIMQIYCFCGKPHDREEVHTTAPARTTPAETDATPQAEVESGAPESAPASQIPEKGCGGVIGAPIIAILAATAMAIQPALTKRKHR